MAGCFVFEIFYGKINGHTNLRIDRVKTLLVALCYVDLAHPPRHQHPWCFHYLSIIIIIQVSIVFIDVAWTDHLSSPWGTPDCSLVWSHSWTLSWRHCNRIWIQAERGGQYAVNHITLLSNTLQGVVQDFEVEGGNEKSNQNILLKKRSTVISIPCLLLYVTFPAMDTQSYN